MMMMIDQPNIPSMFSTAVCGSRVAVLGRDGDVVFDDKAVRARLQKLPEENHVYTGEIALIPPSLGMRCMSIITIMLMLL